MFSFWVKNIPASFNVAESEEEEEKDGDFVIFPGANAKKIQQKLTLPRLGHSEEYFEERIQLLKKQIEKNLPELDKISTPAIKTFANTCSSFISAIDAKTKADDLLKTLQKEHASDDAIKKAQDLVDACEATVTTVDQLVTANGKTALKELGDVSNVEEIALLECTILVQATPKGLADFCAQNPAKHGPLIDDFLSNCDWMRSMIKYGGASNGNYGLAALLYSEILGQIGNDPTDVRKKVALATALEHSTPIGVFKDEQNTYINPINRFWHYVHAYENGELDDAFDKLSVWELRYVVDSDAPDDQLQWGRDYLRAYRPDQVLSTDSQWKYVWSVRTDLGYRHPDHSFDTYIEMISAGGECGPRAFFGRFISKAFGLPTWGVRQPGHAALSRWTPEGWVICLGAAFKWSWWDDLRYTGESKNARREGLDFFEETQARTSSCEQTYYHNVIWLESIAEVMGETVIQNVDPDKLWRSLALVQRRLLAEKSRNYQYSHISSGGNIQTSYRMLGTLSDDIFQAEIVVNHTGSIIIPASSFHSPTKPTKSVMVMQSFLGGKQLHLENDGSVEYDIPPIVPSGCYYLSLRVVNVHRRQAPLLITIENGDGDEMLVALHYIEVQYTVGAWEFTKPIKISLQSPGKLSLAREAPCHGISIKDIILDPC